MARTKKYARRSKGTTKKSRKYKKPAKRFGGRSGRRHRLNWIKDRMAHRNQHYTRGHLHKHYRIPMGEEIPLSLLVKDQHKPGKLGYQVRFALGRRGYYK